MTTTSQPIDAVTVERVLLHGDLQKLTPGQKITYYGAVCDSVGLNPLTQPFQYIVLNGREVLYARREATEQLRKIHKVSIEIRSRELIEGIYVVTARATLPDGRVDENIGCVPLEGLRGEPRANAMMKSETKAKRRVTLAICGLGLLDETEIESLPSTTAQAPASEIPPPTPTSLPPVPPADDPPNAVRVALVDSKPTKNPSVTRYTVTLSTGDRLTTINEWLASLAKEVQQSHELVYVTAKPTKFGSELVGLKRLDEPDLPLEPPITSDDIPF